MAYFYEAVARESAALAIATISAWIALFGIIAFVVLVNVYLVEKKRSLANLWRRSLTNFEEERTRRSEMMLDPLTETYSRRFFEQMIRKEMQRCDRTGAPISFLFIDIDNFRQINEQRGHLVADEVLHAVAGVVRKSLRVSDYIFRFEGDEFVAVLPDTPIEGAAIAANRLKQNFMRQAVPTEAPLSVSIGHSSYFRGLKLEAALQAAELEAIADRSRPKP